MSIEEISKSLQSKNIQHRIVVASTRNEAEIREMHQAFKKNPTLQTLKDYLLSDSISLASMHIEKTSIFIILNNLTATVKSMIAMMEKFRM